MVRIETHIQDIPVKIQSLQIGGVKLQDELRRGKCGGINPANTISTVMIFGWWLLLLRKIWNWDFKSSDLIVSFESGARGTFCLKDWVGLWNLLSNVCLIAELIWSKMAVFCLSLQFSTLIFIRATYKVKPF